MTTTYILDGIWGTHGRWERLRRAVEQDSGPCHIYRYENTGLVSLEVLAARLVAELHQHGGPFHLIGYSMGGLVIREAIRQAADLPLQRAALLHSPHEGSLAACFLPLVACREMRPGSAFLQRLNEFEWSHPTLVTWCATDLMVLPGKSACWRRATRSVRSDIPAHAWPIMSRTIHRSVISFLNEKH
jgi:triacylglycerol lipase